MNRLKRFWSNLRALPPGINDTTTAMMCVDYLTAILARPASRDIPSAHRFEEGELRVITIGPTFAGLVAKSFDQIRGSAVGKLGVMLRMLGALQTIGSRTTCHRRAKPRQQADDWKPGSGVFTPWRNGPQGPIMCLLRRGYCPF